MVVGFEPGQPGEPGYLVAGRHITRSHYEAVADVKTGFQLGEQIRIRRHDYTVVGLTRRMVSSSGDPMIFIPLKDAQQAQFLKDNESILQGRRRTAQNPCATPVMFELLNAMDGLAEDADVLFVLTTNRPEVLDKALLRPGRFDRRITVDRPNLAGRLATLQVHTRNIRLAEDVNLDKIAQATAGCVGADLANLVNEAALRAVRKGRKAVNQNDLLAAFETVIAGSEKKLSLIHI